MSQSECAQYLDCSLDSVKGWCYGKRVPKDGVILEMIDLIQKQQDLGKDLLKVVFNGEPVIFLQCDEDAQKLGFPNFNAYNAAVRRMIECLNKDQIMRLKLIEGK